jgi:peptidoglycan/LPS O-acetylase OafA/YrhL
MRKPSFRKTVALLAVVTALGIGLRTWRLLHGLQQLGDDDVGWAYLERIYYPTYTHLDGLVAGVSLALIKAFRPAWWSALAQRGHALMLASVLPIGAAIWMFQDGQGSVTGRGAWGVAIGFPVLSIGLGLLVASSITNNGLMSRFPVPGAKPIAMLAFSLYLTHKEITHLDRLYLPKLTEGRGAEATFVYTVSCLAGAALLYVCIERPGMLLRDRLAATPRGSVDRQILSEPAL